MSKAINGQGSIKKIVKGRHAGKFRVRHSYVAHGVIVEIDRIRPTQGDCVTLLEESKAAARRALLGEEAQAAAIRRGVTVGEWFDWLVLNDWKDDIAGKTALNRKNRFENMVRGSWGDVPLAKVDAVRVKEWYKELLAAANAKREAGQARTGHAQIMEMKRDLVRLYSLARDPYGRVPSTMVNPFAHQIRGVNPREGIVLSPDQAKKAMLSRKLDIERRAFLALLLLGGVRLGEAMAMTAGQIDPVNGLIYVDRAIHEENGRQWVGLPKKDKKRWVVMCPALAAVLGAHAEELAADELLFGSATDSRKARTFKLTYATWRLIKKQAELPAAMQTRDCRLTHNTWIEKLMLDVSKMTRLEHMGHAGEGVNEVNYVRPLTPAQTLLRDGIEKVAGVKWLWETAA